MKFLDLFDQQQLAAIENAPLYLGSRHPTWYPLFYEQKDPIDYLVERSVGLISKQPNGTVWLRDLIGRLSHLENVDDAASALAEIRAYGALLEAGFEVHPINRSNEATPDFSVNAGDGDVVVEVFAKHQDDDEANFQAAAHDPNGELPDGITRHTTEYPGRGKVTMTTVPIMPAGRPDPLKPQDSIQANMISRVCAIKKNEKQLPDDKPSVLVMDFTNFGGRVSASFLRPNSAAPIEKGHQGLCCGQFWYSMYGWRDAPLFEENQHQLIRMGHDGRFRLGTKLSAVLIILSRSVALLENPWAKNVLPDRARLSLCCYPWFKLEHSIADWSKGDTQRQVDIHRRQVEAMEAAQNFWDERR